MSIVHIIRQQKDLAYSERNKCVAALARFASLQNYNVGIKKTNIPGWHKDWHWCVYIDLPEGQVSWHFHVREMPLFKWLPTYNGSYDGHSNEEKYARMLKFTLPENEK